MNTPCPISPRLRRAFTLIELLTVIAIIGILAAIIIPTVGRVRETAKTAHCASNVRQIAQACLLYANENRGRLIPMRNTDDANRTWRAYIAPYVGTTKKARGVFTCPSDPTNADAADTSMDVTGNVPSSYGLNSGTQYASSPDRLHQYGDNRSPSRTLEAIKQPTRMIMIVDIGCAASGASSTNPSAWAVDTNKKSNLGYAKFPWGGSFSPTDWSVWPRHSSGKTANAGFYDGHVRQVDLIKDLRDHAEGDPLCLFDNH
ncbi:N-terminal cleavage protein [Opitutaceae bacterium TAV5]|nr:N-terminal cleavage protein [Opitutaceae bacterium TAV5]